MPTSLINFVANGTVTTNTQANINTVGNLTNLNVDGVSNLNAISNVKITGGSNGQVIVTDGLGNLVFANSGLVGNGTVTQVDTSGNGLGFTLTGGPITTTGTVTLTVPNATSLRTSLNIGNVANLNLNGNSATFLAGNGSFIVPAGTYSNANVANYLPIYTGNLSAGNANISGTILGGNANISGVVIAGSANITGTMQAANGNITNNLIVGNTLQVATANITNLFATNANFTSNIYAPNILANLMVANTANIVLQLNGNTANFVTIGVTGNIVAGNVSVTGIFSGNGSGLSQLTGANVTGTVANATYALNAGNATNATSATTAGTVTTNAQPNITSVGTLTSLTVSGDTVSGNVYANTGTVRGTFLTGTLTTGAQPNITNVGTLANLNVNGNITGGNANLGNLVTANYFSGNGSLLTGIVVPNTANANFANYAGNVTVSSQPNITSLGTLTGLNVSGNANFTGANVSLGNVANLHITGGTNGYVLQTDGTGNLSWVLGGGSGNGVVGGSNTQVQFNDAGSFGGNSALTFNKTTGITTGSFENIFKGLTKNKGQTISSNVAGNVLLDFNVLSGPILINTAGLDFVGNTNVTANYSIALNFKGNSTTTLDSILDIGDSINLTYIQLVTNRNTGTGTISANISISTSPLLFQIDGANIPNEQFLVNGYVEGSIDKNLTFRPNGSASWTRVLVNSSSNTTQYGYIQQNYSITKIGSNAYITGFRL